jgi:DNA-binding beta-propeller fold protein YncE
MTRHLLIVVAILSTASFGVPGVGHAQTFKVDKFDIKGEGGTDYVAVEAATGHVFVSRATHMMVIEGATGKVLGDIPDTPGVHGAGIATKAGHGFTTNGGDMTVTMFDLKTLAVIKRIMVGDGLDGIMYDEPDDKIILTRHSRPIGTLTALDPKTGDILGTAELEDNGPEGAAADGKGHIFVNNEGKSTIQVIDVKTWKATASWPLAPCEGPTGIAYDKATNRIFSGCNKNSVVVDASTGKIVATIANGTRVDALGWDPSKKLIYVPNGGEGNVTVVHQDSPDKYTVVATVPTFAGAKTITVDPMTHNAYLFQPERGPAPPAPVDAPPPAAGRGRGPQGPIVAAWFIVIKLIPQNVTRNENCRCAPSGICWRLARIAAAEPGTAHRDVAQLQPPQDFAPDRVAKLSYSLWKGWEALSGPATSQ